MPMRPEQGGGRIRPDRPGAAGRDGANPPGLLFRLVRPAARMLRRTGRAVVAYGQHATVLLALRFLKPAPRAAERRVIIRGYFGVGNLGDELLLGAIVRLFLARGWKVTAMSLDPDRTRLEHGIEVVRRGDKPFDALHAIPHLRRARVCLLGPGGILQAYDHAYASLFAYTLTARVAKRLGLKVGLLGVGAGPIATMAARRAVRSVLRRVDAVLFRDEPSRDLAAPGRGAADGVLVAPDLAFLPGLEEPGETVALGTRHPIGFAPVRTRNAPPGSRPASAASYRAEVAAGILAALPPGTTRVPGFAFHETEDSVEVRDFAPQFESAGIVLEVSPGAGTLAGARAWIDSCELVVVSRFHALALAILRGLPVVVLTYHPKVRDLAILAGLEAWTLPCDRVRADEITACIRSAQAAAAEIRQREEAYRRRSAEVLQDALDRLLPRLLEPEG
jgi:polysaccharide pyruvyl transferase WcaK-like protein